MLHIGNGSAVQFRVLIKVIELHVIALYSTYSISTVKKITNPLKICHLITQHKFALYFYAFIFSCHPLLNSACFMCPVFRYFSMVPSTVSVLAYFIYNILMLWSDWAKRTVKVLDIPERNKVYLLQFLCPSWKIYYLW